MTAGAALANALWLARHAGAASAFGRALADPRAAQARWLRGQLARHASSEFGQAHDFAAIRDPLGFARRVPLSDYATIEPVVPRLMRGDRDVLSCGAVTHLAPTSGSTGARKLIPFSTSLQEGFGAAVGAWMCDLARQRPSLVSGPAYWSVSPLPDESLTGSVVPVGFADDAEYLGGASAWLVRQALAVPGEVRHVRDMLSFWALTLLALLRRRRLRLMSVWHPSFLDQLVEAAAPIWPQLVDAVATGECPWAEALPAGVRAGWRVRPAPDRARELQRLGSAAWPRWWPALQVVSCWGEQAAEAGWQRWRAALPHVLVQAKGLLATEGVVTIPFHHAKVLAITSHFFEFLDEEGDVRQAQELQRGERYEVVLTNGGGLWRYRLGDVVECTGRMRATPTLRFLGRAGVVSDLRGEKLSEVFVAETLRALQPLWHGATTPEFVALRANEGGDWVGYELLVSRGALEVPSSQVVARLEQALGANPHYALARRLGQLGPVRVVEVAAGHRIDVIDAHSGRLGDAKPRVLLSAAVGPAR